MKKIEMILKLSEQIFNEEQLEQLKNILEVVLEPPHNTQGDDELITKYINHCRSKNLSTSTIDNYQRKLNMLSGNCGGCFLDMETEEIEAFLYKAKNSNCTAATINNYIACYRTFFEWLKVYEYISVNPMDKIDNARTEKKVLEAFTRPEIEAMRNYFTNPRDRALIEFLLGCGVRISELCGLRFSDLSLNTDQRYVVVHGKGSKQRRVPISDTAIVYLGKYIETRGCKDGEGYLFVPIRGKERKMKRNSIEVMFERASEKLGFHIHPHKFRRTYCTELVAHGMALAYAQKLMGHSTPNTTMLYTNVRDNLVFAEFQKVSNF